MTVGEESDIRNDLASPEIPFLLPLSTSQVSLDGNGTTEKINCKILGLLTVGPQMSQYVFG